MNEHMQFHQKESYLVKLSFSEYLQKKYIVKFLYKITKALIDRPIGFEIGPIVI